MCTGAIINARIRRVYIGASDPKAGCMGSVCDLTQFPFNHRPQTVSGILEEPCAALISDFFRDLRKAPVRREPVVLRAFTADDAPRLKRYCYPKLSEDRVREILQEWDSRCFEGKYCEFFAVTAAGELVGYVNLFEQSERIVSAGAHIFPGYRGRSYGTQSVGQLLALAKERGYTSVTARVRKSNVPSLRLCDTLGFVRKGEDVTAKGIEVWNFSRDLED